MGSLRTSGLVCALALGLGLWGAACSDERAALLAEYKDPSPVKRSGAIRSLARFKDDEAYMLVSRALEDRSAIVRIAAVWSLHEFRGRDTLASIQRAGQDLDPEVREAVVRVLGRREDAAATQSLIQMLARGETHAGVRQLLFETLGARGLGGEQLNREMAEGQLASLQRRLVEGTVQERIQVMREAGRSVHAGAVELLLQGIEQEDGEVVQAAIGALAGRGGAEALRRLQLLLADPMHGLRLAAVSALGDYGPDGLRLLTSALRDQDGEIRLVALEQLLARAYPLEPGEACGLLLDADVRVAVAAARHLGSRGQGCPLEGLRSALSEAGDEAGRRRLLGVLGLLGGPAVVELLAAEQAARKQPATPFELAARARAGDRRPELRRELEQAFERTVDEAERFLVSWPGKRLAAGVDLATGLAPGGGEAVLAEEHDQDHAAAEDAADPPEEEAPGTRREKLSDDEMKELYARHGLGDVRADSPRGISDILSDFPQKGKRVRSERLFPPVQEADLADLALVVEALAGFSPERTEAAVERVLRLRQVRATADLARVLVGLPQPVRLSEAGLTALRASLRAAGAREAEPMTELLVRVRPPGVVASLSAELAAADWEKREVLIGALGALGDREAIGHLTGLLKGYSAISAARALADIGDASASAALREALGQAGPVEEMELLMALARLGDDAELARVKEKLNAPEPDLRRAAVRILRVSASPEARAAVESLRHDLDRLVREEVKLVLESGAAEQGARPEGPGDRADGEHP